MTRNHSEATIRSLFRFRWGREGPTSALVGDGLLDIAPRRVATLLTGLDGFGEHSPVVLALRGGLAIPWRRTVVRLSVQLLPCFLEIRKQSQRQTPQCFQVQRPKIGFINLAQDVIG